MSVLQEGELEFTFGDAWEAEEFDRKGASWPHQMNPVDFIAEGKKDMETRIYVLLYRRRYRGSGQSPAGLLG